MYKKEKKIHVFFMQNMLDRAKFSLSTQLLCPHITLVMLKSFILQPRHYQALTSRHVKSKGVKEDRC